MPAFIVYVRTLLEYISSVWSPHFQSDIDRIESVQRCFTKRLRFLNNMSYSQRLMTPGLGTLQARRLHQDLLLTYKTVFGFHNIDSSKFLYCDVIVLHVGHNFKLFLSDSRVDVRKYFFCQRVVEKWYRQPHCYK